MSIFAELKWNLWLDWEIWWRSALFKLPILMSLWCFFKRREGSEMFYRYINIIIIHILTRDIIKTDIRNHVASLASEIMLRWGLKCTTFSWYINFPSAFVFCIFKHLSLMSSLTAIILHMNGNAIVSTLLLNKSLLLLGLPCYQFLSYSLSLSLYIYIYIYIFNWILWTNHYSNKTSENYFCSLPYLQT